MRAGALTTLITVALFLVVAAPLAAGDQPTGREEAKAGEAEQAAEDAEYYKPRPKTYRERINLIARKPMRKEDRKVVREGQPEERRGVRVQISRKRPAPDPGERKSRFDHVKEIARGPIRQPVRSGD
jgi:hypothetical protein